MTGRRTPLSHAALAGLAAAGWGYDGAKLAKTFVFRDFGEAFAFMSRCVPEIEERDHHPEWANIYNKVTVHLTTHDAGGVTGKDGELARIMDTIAAEFLSKAEP